ncbi:MAG: cupin domain-containing protein [Thermoplasmata archaeon]|nr:MAG: cupin domain-containing protein [Thermoplasmata archaeon]KAA0014917.1 MAG: cupin domain-containing protein [Thermoplasmata archaeon]
MFVKRYDEVEKEEVNEEGAKNVEIQWLIDEKVAPNFAMRRFTIKENGYTPLHKHDWEHEVFVLQGEGALVDGDGNEHPLKPGNFALVEPNEVHQFKNKGKEDFVFLCLIPLK